MSTRAVILKEIKRKLPNGDKDTLCLQQVIFTHPNGDNDPPAFRVIRRCELGKLKSQRGQAAFENLELLEDMIKDMRKMCFKF